MALRLIVTAVVLAAALVAPTAPAALTAPTQAAAPGYALHIKCPDMNPLEFSTYSRPTCPVRMVDTDQMLGDPALAIDPLEGRNMAIAMIHGAVDGQGPTVGSRVGLPFTTFTSDNEGATWDDAFYRAPTDLGNAYGIHSAAAVDPYGHVYVGSTYAVGDQGGPFVYTIGAQKFDSVETVRNEQTGADGSYNLVFVEPVFPKNEIKQTWFLFNPRTDHMTMVWYEAARPGGARSDSDATGQDKALQALHGLPDYAARRVPSSGTSTQPAAPGASVPEPRGTIGIAWTGVDENDTYVRQPIAWSIGPCSGSTNPVLFDGWLYIGCQVDPTQGVFSWHPEAQAGAVELFRMDPDGGEPVYMGASPVLGGAPKLGVRSDGRLVLLTAGANDRGSLDLVGAFGRYSPTDGRIVWSGLQSYAEAVTPVARDERILRANIQDVLYREYSGVVHFILRETIEPAGIDSIQKAIGPKIRKGIVALDEENGVLAIHRLDIGNILNRTDPTLNSQPEMAYEDLSDDIVQLPPMPYQYDGKPLGDTYQREFFAVGDYGQAIFAEIVEVTELRFVPVVQAPGNVPPLPTAASSASNLPAIATATVISGAILIALIANRRKNPAAAKAKFKK